MMIKIVHEDKSPAKGLQQFFKQLLKLQEIDALFLPVRLKESNSIMPSLVTDPERIEDAVPFSPAFPINSARMVSRLSYKASKRKTAVVLRPCEMRAFIELVKLKQGSRQELILIGIDCPKALTSSDYAAYTKKDPLEDDAYIEAIFSQKIETLNGFQFSTACDTCENPFPVNTDISILLHGVDLSDGMIAESKSDDGRLLLESLKMPEAESPENRDETMMQIKEANSKANKIMMEDIGARTDSIVKLNTFFDQCINCYNCRNMCPVCYCKECVFNTDVFNHQPVQYLQWAEKKGVSSCPQIRCFIILPGWRI
ncbi:MAG: formate dehydrogenase [Deltaproteobacteria bacterium]|nr:MAG: formate dehydrogenase [Deltaproteobacteria bacterium]